MLLVSCRPLSQAPVASIAEEAASADMPAAEETHASEGTIESSPGQVEESQPNVAAPEAAAATQVLPTSLP